MMDGKSLNWTHLKVDLAVALHNAIKELGKVQEILNSVNDDKELLIDLKNNSATDVQIVSQISFALCESMNVSQTVNPQMCCCMATMSNEELIERGKSYRGEKESESEMFRLFKLAADRKSFEAQYLVGMCLLKGEGVGRDSKAGFKKLMLAAEGSRDAMYEVSQCFLHSLGTKYCARSVQLWLETAALNGHGKAQFDLALAYCGDYRATVVLEFDYVAGYYWCAEASKQLVDDTDVAQMMGECFEFGRGVGTDIKEALKWFSKPARRGDDDFQIKVAKMQLDLKQTEEAVEFYRLAAEQGNEHAQYELAQLLEQGGKNMTEAVKWYTAAAKCGNCYAKCRLAQILKHGIGGTRRDLKGAVRLFKAASDVGFEQGWYEYGLCLLEGEGEVKNIKRAEELLKMAADSGIVEARLKLANLWIEKAAESGIAEAQFQLGCCYKNGCGRGRDEAEATKCLERAAKQGHPQARNLLGTL